MSYLGDTQFNNPVYDNSPAGTATITVTPDYEKGTYTISNLWGSAAFAGVQAQQTPEPGKTVIHLDSASGTSPYNRLTLFNNLVAGRGTNEPTLQFRYLSFGQWVRRDSDSSGALRQRYATVLYGAPTALADMPRTGSASYGLWVTGAMAISNGYSLGGDGTLDANFATGRLTTRLNLTGDGSLGAVVSVGRFDGTASLGGSGAGFQGQLTSSSSALTGNFTGSFYGPDAAEVGYTFSLRGPVAARPGAEQTLVGVAVGMKK